jgi:hypothetical protein
MLKKRNPTQIEVFRRDVVIHWSGGAPENLSPGKRQAIAEFSPEARKRLAFVASNTAVDFTAMITLTYPAAYETSGKVVKTHLRAFLGRFRRKVGQFSYLWVLEFQARGAPHFHIWIDVDIPRQLYAIVSRDWYEIVGSKDQKHLAAGTRCERMRSKDGAARYAVKYAAKMRQKIVPAAYRDVGRFFGYSRDVKPHKVMDPIPVDGRADLQTKLGDWPQKKRLLWNDFCVCYNAAPAAANAYVANKLSRIDS